MFAKLKSLAWGYFLFALLLCGLGTIFLVFCKEQLLEKTVLVIGALLAVFAIVFAVLTLSKKTRGASFFFRMTFSVLALIGGIVTMVMRQGAIDTVVTLIGLLLVIDGSFKLQTTVRMKTFFNPIWWIMLVISVLSIGGGFFLTKYFDSADSTTLLSVLLGLTLIIDGIGNLISMFAVPANAEAEKAEILAENAEDIAGIANELAEEIPGSEETTPEENA